jgi:hypothetical protein
VEGIGHRRKRSLGSECVTQGTEQDRPSYVVLTVSALIYQYADCLDAAMKKASLLLEQILDNIDTNHDGEISYAG